MTTTMMARSNVSPRSTGASPPQVPDRALTVHVPLRLHRHGGRKRILSPSGAPAWTPSRPQADGALVKALARAFRWRNILETGTHATIDDLAHAENVNPSYASRILRLTLLAPDIVEAILDRTQGPQVTLAALMKGVPVEWEEQRSLLDTVQG